MSSEIIISDTHFGEYVEKRDRPRLEFLKRVLKPADRCILAGDKWDSWKISFNQFVNSGWSELFPILREKNTIYILGNHDPEVPKHPKLFWDTVVENEFKFKNGDQTYAVMHGHLVDSWKHLDRLMERKIARYLYPFASWWQEHVLTNRLTERTVKIAQSWNEEQKDSLDLLFPANVWKITGHTHWAEFDRARKYINAGMIDTKLRRASYVHIDGNGPLLVKHFVPKPFEE